LENDLSVNKLDLVALLNRLVKLPAPSLLLGQSFLKLTHIEGQFRRPNQGIE
jgi:hypothetical protein